MKRILRLLLQLPQRIANAAAPLFRFLAALFLLVAVVLFVAGATKGGAHMSTAAHWQAISPSSFAALETGLQNRFGGWLWSPFLTTLLNVPAYVLFGSLAVLCGFAGRRRRVVNVFVN